MIKQLKIGDRLWSFTYGWVSITRISEEDCEYPIEACREGTIEHVIFSSAGAVLSEGNQDLFWDELKFDVPTGNKTADEAFHLLGKAYSELSLIKKECTCGAANNV